MRKYLFGCLLVLGLIHSAVAAGGGTLDQLKTRFNQDKGTPRLVVLVSPT